MSQSSWLPYKKELSAPGCLFLLGGIALAVSTLLPWIDFQCALPRMVETVVRNPLELPPNYSALGWIVLGCGIIIAIAGLIMIPRARKAAMLCASGATIVAFAVTGDFFWGHAVGLGIGIAALGLLSCLTAIALGWPESRWQRAGLVAATVVLGSIGAIVIGSVDPLSLPTC
jgi:hypothetical protein